MRRVLLIALVASTFLVVSIWRSVREDPAPPKREQQKPSITRHVEVPADRARDHREDRLRLDKVAEEIASQWKAAPTVALDTPDLQSAIRAIPTGGCLQLLSGTPIDFAELPQEQQADLVSAIAGFLQAYRESTADSVLQYQQSRGQEIDPERRSLFERSFAMKKLNVEPATPLESQFRLLWDQGNRKSHWVGICPSVSCLQVWDGRGSSLEELSGIYPQSSEGAEDTISNLVNAFKGTSSYASWFRPVDGSIESELGSNNLLQTLLLADALLIIELDEERDSDRAPFVCRFWFNQKMNLWQPTALMGIAPHPTKTRFPTLLF